MEDQDIIASSTAQTGADGNWQADIPSNIEAGLHKVVAVDESGNQDEALLFVERGWIAQATTLIPPAFGFSILFFLLVIVVLAVNSVRLGKKADESIATKTKRKYMLHAIYFSSFMVVLSLVVGIAMNFSTGILGRALNPFMPIQAADIPTDVSGSITDIFGRPVEGLSVHAGDTRVTTGDSGMYAFSGISKNDGLTITHPRLSKAINKEIDDTATMNFLFDLDVMQSLLDVVDLESRGDLRSLYKQVFVDSMKTKVSQQDFIANYPANFNGSSRNDRAVYIGKVTSIEDYSSDVDKQVYPQAINIEVFSLKGVVNYIFTLEQGKWKLIF
ncbi:hypothetical protein IT407_05235 [Candidatus Uhrbacteria bacterium]|nr:hypothetical protein [Candidatus Uhrbacteria bacterium]